MIDRPPPSGRFSDVLLLFDWNGTLMLDTDRARDATNVVLRTRGLPDLSRDEFTSRFLLPMAAMFHALGIGPSDATDAEAEWNAAAAELPASPRAGLAEALAHFSLGGATLGVVSAASAQLIDVDLERIGITNHFATVDAGASDKLRVLRDRRDDSRRTYYVGDTTYDMHCALAAGYHPIGVADGYTNVSRLLEAGAKAIVRDLREIIDIVADHQPDRQHRGGRQSAVDRVRRA